VDEAVAIQRCCKGDREAFATLVELHQAAVLALCLRMTGNRADALDCSQQTFVQAYQHLALFDQSLPFRPWLLRIAANQSIGLIRKRARQAVPVDDTALDLTTVHQESFERLVEDRHIVNEAVQALPEQYRNIITLHYHQQLGYQEIADMTGIPTGTVGTYLYRAKRLLKQILTQNGGIEGGPHPECRSPAIPTR